jgi:cell wall assembly regulator SMI1
VGGVLPLRAIEKGNGSGRKELEGYAEMVARTVETRMRNGMRRPEAVYKGLTMRKLVEELDKNMRADLVFEHDLHEMTAEEARTKSILRPPATMQMIEEAERRIGRALPDDLKALVQVSNGCDEVGVIPGFRDERIVALDDIFWEDNKFAEQQQSKWENERAFKEGADADDGPDWVNMLPFQLLSSFNMGQEVEIDWSPITSTAIAIHSWGAYDHVRIYSPDAKCVVKARAVLQAVYDEGDEAFKARADKAFLHWYGSRKAFENPESIVYCSESQMPEWDAVFPSYRACVCSVVYNSRPIKDISPVAKQLNAHSEQVT